METYNTREYVVREYESGDEASINEMRHEIGNWGSGTEVDLRYYLWKIKKNPSGHGIVWVAEKENKLVGHYALIPRKLKIGDKLVMTAQGVDIMVDPDYRRKGIFSTLERKACSDAFKKGIQMVFVFPNELSYKVCRKLGYRDAVHISEFVRILNPKKIKCIDIKVKWRSFLAGKVSDVGQYLNKQPNMTIEEIDLFDDRFDDLLGGFSERYDVIFERNAVFLNWRYTDVPSFDYLVYSLEHNQKILGYLVLRCAASDNSHDVRIGYIDDIAFFSGDERVISKLLQVATEHFQRENIDILYCCTVDDTKCTRVLYRKGFFKWRVFPMVVRCRDPDVEKEFFNERLKFFVTSGDQL